MFAVGMTGKILHYNGSGWSEMQSGTSQHLLDVWGSAADNVYAVGAGGTIVHYDGMTWAPIQSTTTEWLRGIWGSSAADIYVVGDKDIILHYDGQAWSTIYQYTANMFFSISGTSVQNIYAAGWDGVYHYDGISWSYLNCGLSLPLVNTIWCGPSGNVYICNRDIIKKLYGHNPTLITLASFVAEPRSHAIILTWSTVSEIDTAGFNLYRSTSESEEYIKLNQSLIPAQGSPTQGASYEFIDNDVKNRKTYFYKLEDIDLNGISTMHGPVSATPRWIWGIFGIFGK
jgi:hypothetical protein